MVPQIPQTWTGLLQQVIVDRAGVLDYRPSNNPVQEYQQLINNRNAEPPGSRMHQVWNEAALELNSYMARHEGFRWQDNYRGPLG